MQLVIEAIVRRLRRPAASRAARSRRSTYVPQRDDRLARALR